MRCLLKIKAWENNQVPNGTIPPIKERKIIIIIIICVFM